MIEIFRTFHLFASSAIPAALLVKQVPDAGKSNFAHDRNYGVTVLHGPEPCITIKLNNYACIQELYCMAIFFF